jgi:hypothetical protein
MLYSEFIDIIKPSFFEEYGLTSYSFIQAFIAKILAEDPSARVIAAGDFNEFDFVKPIGDFTTKSSLTDLDEVVARPLEERYT